MLRESGAPNEILAALEYAMDASVANAEAIPGRTLIAVDVSGSMTWNISENGNMRASDVALVLAAMLRRISGEAVLVTFDTTLREPALPIEAGILRTVSSIPVNGGGTNLALPLQWALKENEKARSQAFNRFRMSMPLPEHNVRFDRMIMLSDNEINFGYQRTVQHLADEYRNTVNPNFWIHAIDMMGYGTQQFIGPRTNIIAGWNETILSFIMQAERGMGGMVETIQNYPL